MKKYKVIMYYSDGTCKELEPIHDDISMAEALGESVCISHEQNYAPSPGGHWFKDGCTVRYEIIEI